jgi:hypothetical protein
LLSTDTIARLPLAMVFIALRVHVQRLSGSFAVARYRHRRLRLGACGGDAVARARGRPTRADAHLLATASAAAGLLVTLVRPCAGLRRAADLLPRWRRRSLALVIATPRGSTLTASSELDTCAGGLLPATDCAAA